MSVKLLLAVHADSRRVLDLFLKEFATRHMKDNKNDCSGNCFMGDAYVSYDYQIEEVNKPVASEVFLYEECKEYV